MKLLSLVIGLLIMVSSSFSQCTNASNIYTFTIHDTVFVKGQNKWSAGITKYEIVKEKKSYADAAACALERGGFLAEIDTVTENSKTSKEITIGASVSNNYVRVSDVGCAAYWLGGNDLDTEGSLAIGW